MSQICYSRRGKPLNIRAQGETTPSHSEIAKDVREGSSLSSTLLNMYMDIYINYLNARQESSDTSPKEKEWNITLFGDDVKPQS